MTIKKIEHRRIMIPFQPHRSSSLLLRLDRNSSCLLWCDRLTAAAWQRTLKIDTVEDLSGCIIFFCCLRYVYKKTRTNIYVTNYTWKWIILILGSNIATWKNSLYFFLAMWHTFFTAWEFILRVTFPFPTTQVNFPPNISSFKFPPHLCQIH